MRSGLSIFAPWEASWIKIIFTPARSWNARTNPWLQEATHFWAGGSDGTHDSTCSCLMVSPPLPMMRPAFPAGMIISCMWPLPLVDSWKEGGVPRPRDTISSNSILAFLRGESWKSKLRFTKKKYVRMIKTNILDGIGWTGERDAPLWKTTAVWKTHNPERYKTSDASKTRSLKRQKVMRLTRSNLNFTARILLDLIDLFSTATDNYRHRISEVRVIQTFQDKYN